MTDPQLDRLFAEGTAPERDAAFAARVGAGIGGARLRRRWRVALAGQAAVALALAVAIFMAGRALGPVLTPLAELAPRFMGVPLPLVLAVALLGLALRAPRLVRLRLA